jgi:hypothetical protein
MLEQFRMLEAALRLGKFTVVELVRESGVSAGTIQRMLHRRTDLFEKEKGLRTGRRGGQPKVYRVREGTIRVALQSAADEPILPPLPSKKTGEPLGVVLVEDTLLRLFPRADLADRRMLLSAADSQFALAAKGSRVDLIGGLRELHRHLVTLVAYQDWLSGLPVSISQTKHFAAVYETLESLLSIREREVRNVHKEQTDRTVRNLLALPFELSAIVDLVRRQIGDEMKSPRSWIDILSASWSLLSHSLWQNVVGDLTSASLVLDWAKRLPMSRHDQPTMPGPAVADQAVLVAGRAVSVVSGPVLEVPTVRGRAVAVTADLTWGFYSSLANLRSEFRVIFEPFQPGDPRNLNVVVESGGDSSPRPTLGKIAALDMDFTYRSITNAVVEAPHGTTIVLYKDLEFVSVPSLLARPHWRIEGRLLSATSEVMIVPDAKSKLANVEWIGNVFIRIGFRQDQRLDVYADQGNQMTFGYGRGIYPERKLGQVISMNVLASSGILTEANIEQPAGTIRVPFGNLNYQSSRNCFILTAMPKPWVGGQQGGIFVDLPPTHPPTLRLP